MAYVDMFVMAVPSAKKEAFIAGSSPFSKIMKELGATRVTHCWGDDVPVGKLTDFRMAVKAEEGEVIAVGWAEYPSKAVRDAANAKMREHEGMKKMEMPFDGKRMIFAGFEIVDVT